MQKLDWGNTPSISKYIAEAPATKPKMMAAAFDKTLEIGLSMDPKLVTAVVQTMPRISREPWEIPALWHRRLTMRAMLRLRMTR